MNSSGVAVRELAVPIDEDGDYSGVVAINVLEHIEDDVAGLQAPSPGSPAPAATWWSSSLHSPWR